MNLYAFETWNFGVTLFVKLFVVCDYFIDEVRHEKHE